MRPLTTGRKRRRRPTLELDRRRRCWSDRRSGVDQRTAHSLAYFTGGGLERRSAGERRRGVDRRRPWKQEGQDCLPFT